MIEQALETAAHMLGTDKSGEHFLDMSRADFLGDANLQDEIRILPYPFARRFATTFGRSMKQSV